MYLRLCVGIGVYEGELTELVMKQINIYFEDREYEALMKVKKGLTWAQLILTLIGKSEEINNICEEALQENTENGM